MKQIVAETMIWKVKIEEFWRKLFCPNYIHPRKSIRKTLIENVIHYYTLRSFISSKNTLTPNMTIFYISALLSPSFFFHATFKLTAWLVWCNFPGSNYVTSNTDYDSSRLFLSCAHRKFYYLPRDNISSPSQNKAYIVRKCKACAYTVMYKSRVNVTVPTTLSMTSIGAISRI